MTEDFFRPAIYRDSDSTTVFLPGPVMGCQVSQPFKFKTNMVPIQDGAYTYGNTREGRTITISGMTNVDKSDGSCYLDLDAMWGALLAVDNILDMDSDNDPYELFLRYDSDSGTYEKFSNCVPVEFTYSVGDNEMSNGRVFKYSLVTLARTPSRKFTGPGA